MKEIILIIITTIITYIFVTFIEKKRARKSKELTINNEKTNFEEMSIEEKFDKICSQLTWLEDEYITNYIHKQEEWKNCNIIDIKDGKYLYELTHLVKYNDEYPKKLEDTKMLLINITFCDEGYPMSSIRENIFVSFLKDSLPSFLEKNQEYDEDYLKDSIETLMKEAEINVNIIDAQRYEILEYIPNILEKTKYCEKQELEKTKSLVKENCEENKKKLIELEKEISDIEIKMPMEDYKELLEDITLIVSNANELYLNNIMQEIISINESFLCILNIIKDKESLTENEINFFSKELEEKVELIQKFHKILNG